MPNIKNFNYKDFTKKLFYSIYQEGSTNEWFNALADDAVYICRGEPSLLGKVSIINYYENKILSPINIYEENYNEIILSENVGQVYGYIIIGASKEYSSITNFSITYQLKDGLCMIKSQHMYYDYESIPFGGFSYDNLAFVKKLLLETSGKRISFKTNDSVEIVDINSIIYISSAGKKSEIHCIDRNFMSTELFGENIKKLPDCFFVLKRGISINTNYIIKITCYELKLFGNNKISIPIRNYQKIRKELLKKIEFKD